MNILVYVLLFKNPYPGTRKVPDLDPQHYYTIRMEDPGSIDVLNNIQITKHCTA